MNKFLRDFICVEDRQYKFKIGKITASALAGFAVGALTATVFWGTAVRIWKLLSELYG